MKGKLEESENVNREIELRIMKEIAMEGGEESIRERYKGLKLGASNLGQEEPLKYNCPLTKN